MLFHSIPFHSVSSLSVFVCFYVLSRSTMSLHLESMALFRRSPVVLYHTVPSVTRTRNSRGVCCVGYMYLLLWLLQLPSAQLAAVTHFACCSSNEQNLVLRVLRSQAVIVWLPWVCWWARPVLYLVLCSSPLYHRCRCIQGLGLLPMQIAKQPGSRYCGPADMCS